MSVLVAYTNAVANAGAALVTHIGLKNASAVELSGGTYARKAVTWTASASGLIRPTTDLDFDIPTGVTVASWAGYSASSGGTDYGGGDLTDVAYGAAGIYRLLAASTGLQHTIV